MVIETKIINVCWDNNDIQMYSFNDGKNKFLFEIDTASNRLTVYEGVDGWNKDVFGAKNHYPSFDKNSKIIDWMKYRFNYINYPDPFSSEFKKYAQKILKLLIFS